jgi:hypothetical protein
MPTLEFDRLNNTNAADTQKYAAEVLQKGLTPGEGAPTEASKDVTAVNGQLPKTGRCCAAGVCGNCDKHKITSDYKIGDGLGAPLGGLLGSTTLILGDRPALLSGSSQPVVVQEGNNPGNTIVIQPQNSGVSNENSTLRRTLDPSGGPGIKFPSPISEATFTDRFGFNPAALSSVPDLVSGIGRATSAHNAGVSTSAQNHVASLQPSFPSQSGSALTVVVSSAGAVIQERTATTNEAPRSVVIERGGIERVSNEKSVEKSAVTIPPTEREVVYHATTQSLGSLSSSSSVSQGMASLPPQQSNALTSSTTRTVEGLPSKAALESPQRTESKSVPSIGGGQHVQVQRESIQGAPSRDISSQSISVNKESPSNPSPRQINSEFQQVMKTFARVERATSQGTPPTRVESTYRSFVAATSHAAGYIPAMRPVHSQVALISRVFTAPDTSPSLAAKIVAANILQIRDSLTQVMRKVNLQPNSPSQSGKQVSRETPVRYTKEGMVLDTGRGGRTAEKIGRTPDSQMRKSATIVDAKNSPVARRIALREKIASIGVAKGERLNAATSRKATKLEHQLQSLRRFEGREGKLGKLNEKLQRKSLKAGVTREKTEERKEGKSAKNHTKIKEIKESLRPRASSSERVTLLKRALQSKQPTLHSRKKTAPDRLTQAALQQELAKLLRKGIKKLLKSEEELLGVLSPMEQRLMKSVIKKLEGAATINELKKALKAAKKRNAPKGQEVSQGPTQHSAEKSQSSTKVTTVKSKQGATSTGTQPSKSLDLNTGEVDDGDKKNLYQAALQ